MRPGLDQKLKYFLGTTAKFAVVTKKCYYSNTPKILMLFYFYSSERSFGRERLCKHKYSNYCVDDVLSQDKEAPSR